MVREMLASLKSAVVAVFSGLHMSTRDATGKWTPWNQWDPGMAEASNKLTIRGKMDNGYYCRHIGQGIPKTDLDVQLIEVWFDTWI